MLKQVLDELRQADGPINLDDVCRKLGVERSALDEMITFWVRKGKLVNTSFVPGNTGPGNPGGCPHCATSDCSAQGCHTEDKMPRTFVVRR